MRHILLCVVILASMAAKAPAQSTSADSNAHPRTAQSSATKAAPDTMSSYDFVLGKWSCKGVTPQGKVDYTFTQNVTKILKGRWFMYHDPSRENDGYDFLTYDPRRNLWVYVEIGDKGYAMGTSPPWKGNTQTWTGYSYENGRRRSWGRIIFKKVSDREKREDFYTPSKNGSFKFVGSEVCTKTD